MLRKTEIRLWREARARADEKVAVVGCGKGNKPRGAYLVDQRHTLFVRESRERPHWPRRGIARLSYRGLQAVPDANGPDRDSGECEDSRFHFRNSASLDAFNRQLGPLKLALTVS